MKSGGWRRIGRSLALVPAFVALAAASAAGPRGAASDEPQPFLLALRGQSVALNYTPGALDRAVHVQRRLELLGHDFLRWAGGEERLRVFVLNREEWGRLGFLLPYGLPGRLRTGILAVPAIGDAGTVELWTRIRGEPPPPLPGIPMKGTAEEASSLAMADLLMEVEACRVLLSSHGLRAESPWLHQVLAHTLARTAFVRYEAARLPEIDAFFASLGNGVPGPLPLSRYTAGLELGTLLWFESRFQEGARRVVSGRKNAGKALLKTMKKNGGVLSEAAFFDFQPEMRAWLAETFPAPAPVGP